MDVKFPCLAQFNKHLWNECLTGGPDHSLSLEIPNLLASMILSNIFVKEMVKDINFMVSHL